MKEQVQLTKFFISSFYKKPKQQMLQVVLIIALFYMLFQLTALNFLVYSLGDIQLFMFYNLAISVILVFILTCCLSATQVFAFNEFKFLAPLPLSYRKLSTAKVVSSITVPIVLTMVIQFPTVVFLFIDFRIIEAIIILTFLPVVSGLIALSLLFVLSFVNRFYYKFKHLVSYLMTKLVIMIVIPVSFIVYFVGKSTFAVEIDINSLDGLINSANLILRSIFETASTMPVIQWIIESFVSNKLSLPIVLVYLGIILTNLFLYCFVIQNISANYFRNSLLENNKANLKGSKVYISKNKWSIYLQRERWVIQSEAYFKLQVILGVLLAPIASSVFLLLIQYDALPAYVNISKEGSFEYYSYFILFFSCMNNISGTPYSREGKHHDLLMSTPLHPKCVYFSKVFISSVMGILSVFISFILYAIFGYWELNNLFMLFVISGLVVCYNLLAPLYDMKNPNIEWENPSIAVKSNPNVLISLFYGMPILIVIAAIHFCLAWIKIQPYLTTLILLLIVIFTISIIINRLKVSFDRDVI